MGNFGCLGTTCCGWSRRSCPHFDKALESYRLTSSLGLRSGLLRCHWRGGRWRAGEGDSFPRGRGSGSGPGCAQHSCRPPRRAQQPPPGSEGLPISTVAAPARSPLLGEGSWNRSPRPPGRIKSSWPGQSSGIGINHFRGLDREPQSVCPVCWGGLLYILISHHPPNNPRPWAVSVPF